MYENNGGTEENFYKTLIDTDVSSLIAFQQPGKSTEAYAVNKIGNVPIRTYVMEL